MDFAIKRPAELQRIDDPPMTGLASLARHAFAGGHFSDEIAALLRRVAGDARDASALLDLSIIERLRGNAANGDALQAAAIDMRKLFSLAACPEAGAPRLLVFVAPGGFMSNTPVEFLLEGRRASVDLLFVDERSAMPSPLPPCDVAMVAVAESKDNLAILEKLARAGLDRRPLINPPERVARLSRDGAWRLLGNSPGVRYPENRLVSRQELSNISRGRTRVNELLHDADFPIIARPVDSHAGENLSKIDDADALALWLAGLEGDEFFIAPFVDYSDARGAFRKYRVALVEGRPFAVHMAISTRWMVHYLNADMMDNSDNRREEERFFEAFEADFAARHAIAFAALADAAGLDYMLIDCAESVDGQLLVFEVGTAMIAHTLDCPDLFPYKARNMEKLFDAFYAMICRKAAKTPASNGAGSTFPIRRRAGAQ